MQTVLVGRALDVYVSLPIEQSISYDTVKREILRRYDLVPEAHRQCFRHCKKTDRHTYVEFAHEKKYQFGRWCASQKADSIELLRELILLEDFKKSVPYAVATYLNEQRVTTLAQASVLANEFVLTHRRIQENRDGSDQRVNRPPVKGRLRPRVTGANLVSKPRLHRNSSGVKTEMVCFYCKKSGHKISECHALKKKKRNSVGFEKAKEDKSEKTKNQKLNLKEPSGELQATFKQNGQAQLQLNRLKQEVLEKERRYERELKSSKDERNKLLGEASKREDDLQFLAKQLREQLEHKDRILKEKSDIISSLEQQREHAQEDSKGQIEQLNVEPKAQDLDEGKLKMDLESFSKLQILFIWLLMPVTVLVWYFHSWAQMVLNIWL